MMLTLLHAGSARPLFDHPYLRGKKEFGLVVQAVASPPNSFFFEDMDVQRAASQNPRLVEDGSERSSTLGSDLIVFEAASEG